VVKGLSTGLLSPGLITCPFMWSSAPPWDWRLARGGEAKGRRSSGGREGGREGEDAESGSNGAKSPRCI
jgi:hypothetical protein